MIKSIRNLIALSFFVITLTGIACTYNVGGPEAPDYPTLINKNGFDPLELVWETALKAAQNGGNIQLIILESQLTSYVADRFADNENPLLSNPQVYLRNGEIQIYGQIERGFLIAGARLIIQVDIDEDGNPAFEITSADFGPWPVPDGLLAGFSMTLDEAFTGKIGPLATGIRIEDIAIQDGLLAITGKIR